MAYNDIENSDYYGSYSNSRSAIPTYGLNEDLYPSGYKPEPTAIPSDPYSNKSYFNTGNFSLNNDLLNFYTGVQPAGRAKTAYTDVGGALPGQVGLGSPKNETTLEQLSSWTGYRSPPSVDYSGSSNKDVNYMTNLYNKLISAIPTSTMQSAPTYTAPKWDENKVSKYASKFSSPYINEIRRAIREAIMSAGSYSSPALRRYYSGAAVDRASEGMGKIMSQAAQHGLQTYGNEYNRLVDESKTNFMATLNNIQQHNNLANQQNMMLFNAALSSFFKG